MAATKRPWSGIGAATPSGAPGWCSIPAWYLLGTEDRAIPPAGQRFMAERGNARIEEVAASHASMVSQPEAVTRLILSAVEETSAAGHGGVTAVPRRRAPVDAPVELADRASGSAATDQRDWMIARDRADTGCAIWRSITGI